MYVEITNPAIVDGRLVDTGEVLDIPCEQARQLFQGNHCIEARNLPGELDDDEKRVETTEAPEQVSLRNRRGRRR
jgi:hypothetical protein